MSRVRAPSPAPLRSGGGCRVCALAGAVVLGSSKGTASNQPGPERHSWAVVGPKMLAVARRSGEWRGRCRRAGIAELRCAWPPSMTRTPDSAACSVTWTASSGVQLPSGHAQDHDQGVAHQLCASSHSRLKRQTQHPYAQRMVPSPSTNREEYVARSSMSRETGHVLQSS